LGCGYLLGCTHIFCVCLLATGKLERSKYTPTFLITVCTRIFTCVVAMLALIYFLTFHTDIRAVHKSTRTWSVNVQLVFLFHTTFLHTHVRQMYHTSVCVWSKKIHYFHTGHINFQSLFSTHKMQYTHLHFMWFILLHLWV
jgi:hypothetical protein